MQTIYEHQQFGNAVVWLIGIPTIGLVIAVILSGRSILLLFLLIIVVFMALTTAVFSTLTVTVDREKVSFHFGLNTIRRAIWLSEITSVRVVRNPLWLGLGIHFFPRGIIYNVSGLDGIELALNNGRLVRIGSDEPSALAQAIEQAKNNLSPTH